MEFNGTLAIRQYIKRKAANADLKHVDNSRLRAGSWMVYYCRFCRAHTVSLPENHWGGAKTMCDPCKALHDHGLIDATGKVV